MLKKIVLCAMLATGAAGAALSQSADKVTEILESSAVTYGQMCYLSAVAHGIVADTASEEYAFAAMQEAGYVPPEAAAEDVMPLKQIAYTCAQSWGIKGGLFYRLFHSPRYAYRQLAADGVIPQTSHPRQTLNGHEAINIITECLERYTAEGGEEEE